MASHDNPNRLSPQEVAVANKMLGSKIQIVGQGTEKGDTKKDSFAKETAKKGTQAHVEERARQSARKGNSRNSPNVLRGISKLHHGVTGSTSAFSRANPNLIFVGGLGLIVASGFSSHRIQNIFHDALNPNDAIANHPQRMWQSLKVIGVQLLWVFGVTFLSRLSAGFANFMLVVIIGIWILWLMRNPETFILLNAASQDDTSTSQQNSISTLATQLNNSQLVNSNLYPGSLFPQNPNTTSPQTTPTPNPTAPNSIYQNVIKSLRGGGGGGSRGVR